MEDCKGKTVFPAELERARTRTLGKGGTAN